MMIKGHLNNLYCNKTQNMCCGNAFHIFTCFESFSIALMKLCLYFLCAHKVYLGLTVVKVQMESLVSQEHQGSVDHQVSSK